jgi:GR25 family glycosyltransferase involved in LPS biosynthesis
MSQRAIVIFQRLHIVPMRFVLLCLSMCTLLLKSAADEHSPLVAAQRVFYINLAPSTDRRAFMESWLREALPSSSLKRVDAINAYDFRLLQNTTELSVFVAISPEKRTAGCALELQAWAYGSCGTLSAIACGLSHAKAIVMAYAMGLQEALFLEDDMGLMQLAANNVDNHHCVWSYLDELLSSLPADWKVVQVSSLIFSPAKDAEISSKVKAGLLWSERDGCSGTDFSMWGAAAYVMSRRGMHKFISRHMPQLITATIQQAEDFCVKLDVRSTAVTTVADNWVYDMSDVYYSHIPLFMPLASIASGSTVQLSQAISTMPEEQFASVTASIAYLRHKGVFNKNVDNQQLIVALQHTRQWHHQSKQQRSNNVRYVLIPDLGIDALHVNATQTGADTNITAIEVTHYEQRLQLVEQLNGLPHWTGKLWHTLIESYFSRCSTNVVDNGSSTIKLRLLIPLSLQLKGLTIPVDATAHTIAVIVQDFCNTFRRWNTIREFMQCYEVLRSCVDDAREVLL